MKNIIFIVTNIIIHKIHLGAKMKTYISTNLNFKSYRESYKHTRDAKIY